MAPDAPASRRSARGQAKRSYAESDGEDEPERVEVPKSKAKPSAKGRKPASKKAKKLSEDIIEDEDDEPEPPTTTDDTGSAAAPATSEPKVEESKVPEAKESEEAQTEQHAPVTITIGSQVPGDIKLANQEGTEVEVGDLTKDKGVVIFLVPKANTPGCTNQACSFRDRYEEIQELGYDVYSLSQDTPKALTSWKASKELPYALLSDPGQTLIKPLGASKTDKSVTRSHFVLSKGGKLLLATVGVKPQESTNMCIDFIKSL